MDLKKRIQKLELERQPAMPINSPDLFEFEEMTVEEWNATVAPRFLESYLRKPSQAAGSE
jgi:hypothetical protein